MLAVSSLLCCRIQECSLRKALDSFRSYAGLMEFEVKSACPTFHVLFHERSFLLCSLPFHFMFPAMYIEFIGLKPSSNCIHSTDFHTAWSLQKLHMDFCVAQDSASQLQYVWMSFSASCRALHKWWIQRRCNHSLHRDSKVQAFSEKKGKSIHVWYASNSLLLEIVAQVFDHHVAFTRCHTLPINSNHKRAVGLLYGDSTCK